MGWFRHIAFLLSITKSEGIARRYFVVNGFDGALTLLGLLMGFYVAEDVPVHVAFSACLGAAIALGASGVTGAYLSEAAERRKALHELEQAMVSRLKESAHGQASKLVPLVIALVNGLSPLLISLIIMIPLWLSAAGLMSQREPLLPSITLAFVLIFVLGAFLGRVGQAFWLWTGLRAVLVALATSLLILALG